MENVDLDLFADWPEQPGGRRETRLSPHAGRLLLEVKSREAGQDDLRMLLGDMTREMRARCAKARRRRSPIPPMRRRRKPRAPTPRRRATPCR